MEWQDILQAVLSLIFVIGLLLLTLWVFKYCELKGLKCRLVKNLKAGQRLEVIEFRRLDSKNSVVLLRRDDREYLLLLGTNSARMLDNTPSITGPSNND